MAVQQPPSVGQPQMPGRALDPRRPGRDLQTGQRAAGGEFRHAECTRSGRQVAEVGDARKGTEIQRSTTVKSVPEREHTPGLAG